MNTEKPKKRRFVWAVCYGLVLAGFTGYVMLDTFVIPKESNTDAGKANMSLFENVQTVTVGDSSASKQTSEQEQTTSRKQSGKTSSGRTKRSKTAAAEDNTQTETKLTTDRDADAQGQYTDENISITVSETRVNDTDIHVADIWLSSVQYMKTAFAKNTYGRNVTDETSDIAEQNNAILAINGDYYGARSSGCVIRNGVLYQDNASPSSDILCIYADGHFEITNSGEKSGQELIDEGVWQAFTFGPALVENGSVTVSATQEVGKAMASNPRTAIGILGEGHYVFVVSDGRTSDNEGLSLSELAAFMQSLGCTTAYNLDGGGSSTMVFNNEIINVPTTSGNSMSERKVSDIVYIGY